MKRKAPQEPKLLKLNIAGGQQRIEGYTNIDIANIPESDIVHDLNVYPWPIRSESVEEALASHYLEHIPHRAFGDKGADPLFMFFDELWRIMVVGGKATIITPYYANARAFQDPTHTRFICEATYLYANKEWRKNNKLDHYPISADFDFGYSYACTPQWAQRSEEARQFAILHYINVIQDLQVVMTKREIVPAAPEKNGKVSRRTQKLSVVSHA